MRTDFNTTVAADAGIVVEMNHLRILGNGLGRAIFPALPAKFAQKRIHCRALQKVPAHKTTHAFGAEGGSGPDVDIVSWDRATLIP